MRDSVIFYRSFYEAIDELPLDLQAKVYKAIFEYSLNYNEIVLEGIAKTIFTLIKPQIEANNKRFENVNDNVNDNSFFKEIPFTKKEFKEILYSKGADKIHVDDWCKVRDKKKAAYTITALQAFLKECAESNYSVHDAVRLCAERNWQGFKKEWLKNDDKGNDKYKGSSTNSRGRASQWSYEEFIGNITGNSEE